MSGATSGKRVGTAFTIVMAGLVPAIHVLFCRDKEDVDARNKCGHDGKPYV
jgi:hypothetical protein